LLILWSGPVSHWPSLARLSIAALASMWLHR